MADFRQVFGEVALGHGLAPSTADRVAEYDEDPADAFTRHAAFLQPPGEILTKSQLLLPDDPNPPTRVGRKGVIPNASDRP